MWTTQSLSILFLVLVGTVTCNAEGFATKPVYGARTEFTASYSPIWSYGYGWTGKTFIFHSAFTYDCLHRAGIDCWGIPPDGDLPQVAANATGVPFVFGNTAVGVTYALLLHPGPRTGEDAIVRWTCPKSGTYNIEGFFEILDAFPTGVQPKIFVNDTDVTTIAFHGDSGKLTGPGANLATLKAGQRKRFLLKRALSQRDVVSFGVNRAGDYGFDTTGFNAIIRGNNGGGS